MAAHTVEYWVEFSDSKNYYPIKKIEYGNDENGTIPIVRLTLANSKHVSIKAGLD